MERPSNCEIHNVPQKFSDSFDSKRLTQRLTQKFWKPLKDHAAFRWENLDSSAFGFFGIWPPSMARWAMPVIARGPDAGSDGSSSCGLVDCWYDCSNSGLDGCLDGRSDDCSDDCLVDYEMRWLLRWLFRCSLIVWFRLIRSFNLVWRSGGVGRASWGRGKILQQVHLQTHL